MRHEAELTLRISARSAKAANRILDAVAERVQDACEEVVQEHASTSVNIEWTAYPAGRR